MLLSRLLLGPDNHNFHDNTSITQPPFTKQGFIAPANLYCNHSFLSPTAIRFKLFHLLPTNARPVNPHSDKADCLLRPANNPLNLKSSAWPLSYNPSHNNSQARPPCYRHVPLRPRASFKAHRRTSNTSNHPEVSTATATTASVAAKGQTSTAAKRPGLHYNHMLFQAIRK